MGKGFRQGKDLIRTLGGAFWCLGEMDAGDEKQMCWSPLTQPAGLDQWDKEGRFWQEKGGDSAQRAMMGGTVQDSFNV